MFIDSLIDQIKIKNNPTVVGLDPRLEFVPGFIQEEMRVRYGNTLKGAANSIFEFNKRIIDAIYDLVPAVKPQIAYYELYGKAGIGAFIETVNYAKSKGLIVIADGKRNDIGSTAKAYSEAFLGKTKLLNNQKEKIFDVDALTVNGYLGIDGITPFLEECKEYKKGIFVLVKTSNPSSGDFQDLKLEDGRFLYEAVAEKVSNWGEELIGKSGYSNVCAVVGATYPEQSKRIRGLMKNTYILVPGFGAQGGTAKDTINNFNKDGLGAIVNASRSIMLAYKSDEWKNIYLEKDFEKASRAEVEKMKAQLNLALENI